MIGLKRGIVRLIPYDREWDELYKVEEKILKLLLKSDIVDIQHIGSTSIPNLCAKPIIDILVGVITLESVSRNIDILDRNGFIFRKDSETEERLLFIKGGEDYRTHHIHVVEWNGYEWRSHIAFRNFLRNNNDIAVEYSILKEKLAERYPKDREAYTNAKNDFIEKIIKKANV